MILNSPINPAELATNPGQLPGVNLEYANWTTPCDESAVCAKRVIMDLVTRLSELGRHVDESNAVANTKFVPVIKSSTLCSRHCTRPHRRDGPQISDASCTTDYFNPLRLLARLARSG
jgi:hypothetical protein